MAKDVDLGPELEKVVADLVASGRFASRSALLEEGARLVVAHNRQLDALDTAIEAGIADEKAGRLIGTEELLDHLHRQLSKRSAA
ncbi:ribbon-helix-helix domain-containing protein [Sphingomonas sp. TDK1]|uniref:ribbon-helix-helix domain-containing protein n=1 Tax=Sphingomonas sp. TDK1 TaxID=453247 RepID=UPI0007D8F448|nr:hypothetical protein [Sphingomonas sp. TDK1]OAN65959.1 hypothetical protein A7X12_14595 [Sphingomonas sp. TDK1]